MKRYVHMGVILGLMAGAAGYAAADEPAELFAKKCSNCHGKDGKGKTKMGEKLQIVDLTDATVQGKLTDQAINDIVSNGVKDKDTGKDKMSPFKDKLSGDDIKGLVGFVRGFKGK